MSPSDNAKAPGEGAAPEQPRSSQGGKEQEGFLRDGGGQHWSSSGSGNSSLISPNNGTKGPALPAQLCQPSAPQGTLQELCLHGPSTGEIVFYISNKCQQLKSAFNS